MGNEAQLFYIKVLPGIESIKLKEIFKKHNFQIRKSELENNCEYEYFTNKGIIEIQFNSENQDITYFTLRFSFGNPSSVIKQTFDFLNELSKELKIQVISHETQNILSLDTLSISKIKKEIIHKKVNFEKTHMKINTPIRCGTETFNYIRKHKQIYTKKKILEDIESLSESVINNKIDSNNYAARVEGLIRTNIIIIPELEDFADFLAHYHEPKDDPSLYDFADLKIKLIEIRKILRNEAKKRK